MLFVNHVNRLIAIHFPNAIVNTVLKTVLTLQKPLLGIGYQGRTSLWDPEIFAATFKFHFSHTRNTYFPADGKSTSLL
jgi:hypothetical protein